MVQWDVDSLDWKDLTVEQITDRVVGNVKNGSICLFHNGTKNTAAALPVIIEALQTQGYKIVPVSELIYKDGYTIDTNGVQKKINTPAMNRTVASVTPCGVSL